MRNSLIIVACFISALLAGCATSANFDHVINSWRGANIDKLVDVWGYPKRQIKAPNGNSVYIYEHREDFHFPKQYSPAYSTVQHSGSDTIITYHPSSTAGGGHLKTNCTMWFEANSQHTIVKTRAEGNGCTLSQQQAKRLVATTHQPT